MELILEAKLDVLMKYEVGKEVKKNIRYLSHYFYYIQFFTSGLSYISNISHGG